MKEASWLPTPSASMVRRAAMTDRAGKPSPDGPRLDSRGAARRFIEETARVNLWEVVNIQVTCDSRRNLRVEPLHTAEQVTVARFLDNGDVAVLAVRWQRALESHRWYISRDGLPSAILQLRSASGTGRAQALVHADQLPELIGARDDALANFASFGEGVPRTPMTQGVT